MWKKTRKRCSQYAKISKALLLLLCIYTRILQSLVLDRSVRSGGHRQSADLYRSDPCPLHLPQTSLPGTQVSHTGHRTSSAWSSSSFFLLESPLLSEVVFQPNGRENKRKVFLFAGTYPTLSATEIAFTPPPPPTALPPLSHPEVRLVQL